MIRFAVIAVLAAVVGAGPASAHRVSCPSSNPPNELVLYGGSGQTAQLGTAFPAKLQAQLANTNGCAVTGDLAGIDVEFDAPDSGASGIFAGSGSRQAAVGTDAQGIATAPAFTANDTSGSYAVDATSGYGGVTFSLVNTSSGLAAGIGASGGTPQAGTVGSQYAQPLQARVTDPNGSPVQGAAVTFAIVPGPTGAGATFVTGATATATTDSNGLATSPPLVANASPGRFGAVASTGGIASVAAYELDNHAAVQTLTALGGTTRSATIDTAYAAPLTVRLVDGSGQPVEGALVTFTLGSGAAFAAGGVEATALTDLNGVAASPTLTAGATAGSFTAFASAAGSSPVAFVLRNLPAHVSLALRRRNPVVGKPYRGRLVAALRDSRDRPIGGVTVVFSVHTTGRASASFPGGAQQATVVTAANGRATAPRLVAGTAAGTFTVTAAVEGSTDAVSRRLQNLAARPANVIAGAATGESTPVATRFPVPLAVTVTDRYGNRVPKARVTFSAPRDGAGGVFAARRSVTVRTNADGIAVAPPFTANRTVGGYLVRAVVRGSGAHTTFALVNTPQP